ncbi:efflux RND transporter periplasmic adaptor subunit [Thalassotalea ganghwensis]
MHFYKILLTLSLFTWSSVAFGQQNFTAEQIVAEPFLDSIERTGRLDFKRTVSLSFKSVGYLTQLSVDEGDSFNKDQILASLDTEELIEKKNATYAKLLQAKREVNRVKKLLASSLSSKQDLDAARTNVETTRAEFRIASYNLEKAQIKAPFNGVVLARQTELGELQSPGVEALKVAELDNNLVIKVALTGAEVSQARIGQKVRVTLDNIGVIEGRVNRIPAIANTDGHLFTIDVLIPNLIGRGGVIAGQLAKVVIDFTNDNLVYKVPFSSLVSVNDQGQAVLLVQQGSEIKHQAFDIYKMTNDFIFLLADDSSNSLRIITQGWQHIQLGK